jgi:isatin hydrolase
MARHERDVPAVGYPAQLGGDHSRLVDLTLLLAEDLPCWWPTHLPYQHKTFNYFADRRDDAAPLLSHSGPYQTRWLLIDEHTGTHVGAPAHFVAPPGSGLPHAGEAGEITVDRVPLDQLTGPAAVIDVPEGLPGAAPGVSAAIGPEVLDEHEWRFGPIDPGAVVLFRTGWDRPTSRGRRAGVTASTPSSRRPARAGPPRRCRS